MTTSSMRRLRQSDFLCGCSFCGLDESEVIQLAPPTEEFVRCQCTLCGHGGCSALVHPVRSLPFLSPLSLSEWILADIDAIAGPYCGDCEQHYITLHRQRILEVKLKQHHLEQRRRKGDESATDSQPTSKKFKSS